MEEKDKHITKSKAHIVKAVVGKLNLNISYQIKKYIYKIYYDDEDDDLNDDVDGASESSEESDNVYNHDEDDNDVTYEKETKKRKESVTI